MDQVPFAFRERVAALWKCCERDYVNRHHEGCLDPVVPDCEWTMKSQKQHIDFSIAYCNDLTMDEVKNQLNLKFLTIERIIVDGQLFPFSSFKALLEFHDVDAIMKFVAFLSNEPVLLLRHFVVDAFDTPEGATLLSCLSEMKFSKIKMLKGFAIYNQLLENQFSRRKPTEICINDIFQNEAFYIEHLANGNIKRFTVDVCLPTVILERIIHGILLNAENGKDLRIEAMFVDAKKLLEGKLAEGLCYLKADGSFCFTTYKPAQDLCIRIGSHHRVIMSIF